MFIFGWSEVPLLKPGCLPICSTCIGNIGKYSRPLAYIAHSVLRAMPRFVPHQSIPNYENSKMNTVALNKSYYEVALKFLK